MDRYPNLNYSISSFNDPNQYIIPNAEPGHQRGRMELAFSQIGGSVLTGAALGGTLGTVRGYGLIKELPSISVKRTQMLNSIVKGSSSSANAFGVVAVLYSTIGVALSYMREDDDINTSTAASITGLMTGAVTSKNANLQKISQRSLVGATIGLALSVVYTQLIKPKFYD